MATFLSDSNLNAEIERLIKEAEFELVLVSPFIKLHSRLIEILTARKSDHQLKISILFGKNENDIFKSIGERELKFFQEFPNVEIRYNPRLHAKYYGNDDYSIITSMNLYDFSLNNNIEAGILLQRKGLLGSAISNDKTEADAWKYFEEKLSVSELIFKREPEYKSGILTDKYIGSKTSVDKLSEVSKKEPVMGFCIRTGKPIPFNPEKPLSKEAYESWAKYKNPDFAERFCHKTGKPSNGKTSVKNPILI